MEHIVHTNIYQRLQDLQAGISSCKENLQNKLPDGGTINPTGEIMEINLGPVRNLNPSKVPHGQFTSKCGLSPSESDLVLTKKAKI